MQVEDYVRVVWKRWWIIGLIALTAAVAAYVFSKLQQPEYRSQARYSVLINRLDSGANAFANQTLNNYRNLVYNKDQLQGVNNQLGLDRSGEYLLEYVRVQPQPDQLLMVIEVDWETPAGAQQIAAAVGERLNASVVEANRTLQGEDRVSLRLIESPQVGYLAKPITRVNVLAGAILGLILGVLLAFVLEYLDDTIKTAGDVERYTELITIGAIPSAAAQGGRSRPRLRPAQAAGIIAQSAQRSEKQTYDH
jgi:capsular polysaccharide biosynthesis protein